MKNPSQHDARSACQVRRELAVPADSGRRRISRKRLAMLLVHVLLIGAGGIVAGVVNRVRAAPTGSATQYTETRLATYKKGGNGAFSPYWVALILDPAKGTHDKSTFIELNGKRMGPYQQVSGKIVLSPDGQHVAYAAEKPGNG